jgi:hypothetical protein
MSLSAARQSNTPGLARHRSAFCPLPSLTRWLPDEHLSGMVHASGATRDFRCWPMELVVWGVVLQALCPHRSQPACVQLLCRTVGLDIAAYSGSFCKARQRLQPGVPRLAAQWVAREASGQTPRPKAAHGRRVVQWDGTGCSLTDRPANQAAYPQPAGQQPGCGFPQMRFVVMRDAATGCFLALEFGSRFDHDAKLGSRLWDKVAVDDIVVVDRGFASYGLYWGMTRRRVGVIMRQHQGRTLPDELVGELDEQTVTWRIPRTDERGEFWDDDLPLCLTVRVVRYRLKDGVVVVLNTNLGEAFSAADIRDLYEGRWDEEVSFRDVKETLGLDPLAACTPELARTLVWGYVLAYNLVRATMGAASLATGQPLERLSVKHTLQVLEFSLWTRGQSAEEVEVTVLAEVGAYRMPDRNRRPGQARRVKRRHGKYPLLTQPRSMYPARERAA